MPGGGSKRGERRGGRQKGVPNRATLEAALKAEAEVKEAQASGAVLAKDVLDNLMKVFMNVAQIYAPKKDEPLPKASDARAWRAYERRLARFERWALNARDTAKALAPFQSPTFRSIEVSPMFGKAVGHTPLLLPPPDGMTVKEAADLYAASLLPAS